jgi:ABC-type transporter Mla subunit MlaD
MKTVTMRLRGITDEGEEVQDLLPKLESEFNKLGITIRKDADTFKSTYDIFDSLASKWDELTDFQRANILELIAGKRQGNIISSMLGNWEDAQDSLTTALTSGGSAMREFIKYMDSIEYKSGVLQSSLTNLWSKALSSGALKGIIDAGIRFVETIDVMVNHTDYLSAVILPGFVSVLLLKVVPALITSIGAMKTATTAAAMMNAAINPLLAVVTLATVGFGLYSSTVAHAERQKREYIETTERELELAESEGKAVNVLAEQYDKLEDKVGETEEGKKKLDKIISHLIKINPDLKQGIDGQKLSYDNLGTAIQRTIDKMNELQRASRAALMEAYKAELKGIYDARKELDKRIKYEEGRTPTRMTEGLSEVLISSLNKQLDQLDEEAREIGKKIQSLYVPSTSPPGAGVDDGFGFGGGSSSSGTATTSPYSSKLTLSYRDLQIAIENVSFELDKLKEKEKSLSGSDLINNLSQQNELINKRIKLLEELNWRYGEDLPRLKIQLLELGFEYENIESQADKYNALSDAQKEKVDILVKSIDDLTDSYMKNSLEILQNKNDLNDLSATIEKVTEETQKYARELGEYLINKEIESLKQLKEQIRDTYQSKIDRIQREIDRLERRNDLLEEEETRQQKLLDISKQREKLENIKEQRNVRMFMDGQWTWVANPRQIREETTRLQDMQEEYFQWEEDLRRKNEIQKLKDQISALQTELKNEEQKYDTQIKNLQLFISEYKDRQSEFYGEQVKGLNNLMESLKDIEARSYEKRIEQLGDFVDKYNKLLNSISGMSVKPTTTTSKSTSSLGETWYIPGLGNVSTPSNPTNLPEGAIRVKHKGGFAGESSSRLPDLVNKMFNVSPNEVLVKALKNELFIPEQNIFKNFMPNMQNLISTIQPNVAGATPSNNYVVHIDKVVTEDAASFVNLLPTLAHQYKGKK